MTYHCLTALVFGPDALSRSCWCMFFQGEKATGHANVWLDGWVGFGDCLRRRCKVLACSEVCNWGWGSERQWNAVALRQLECVHASSWLLMAILMVAARCASCASDASQSEAGWQQYVVAFAAAGT